MMCNACVQSLGGTAAMRIVATFLALILAGCASSTTIPITNDVVQVNTSAAPACGGNGARRVAVQQAAVETINRGYDRFIVMDGQHQNNVGVVGYMPQQSYSTGSVQGSVYGNQYSAYGSSNTTTYGGQPIYGGSHDQALTIKMFRNSDPGAGNAIDARQTLGPEWQEIVSKGGPRTCG
jgi:hypothetical protein